MLRPHLTYSTKASEVGELDRFFDCQDEEEFVDAQEEAGDGDCKAEIKDEMKEEIKEEPSDEPSFDKEPDGDELPSLGSTTPGEKKQREQKTKSGAPGLRVSGHRGLQGSEAPGLRGSGAPGARMGLRASRPPRGSGPPGLRGSPGLWASRPPVCFFFKFP